MLLPFKRNLQSAQAQGSAGESPAGVACSEGSASRLQTANEQSIRALLQHWF